MCETMMTDAELRMEMTQVAYDNGFLGFYRLRITAYTKSGACGIT